MTEARKIWIITEAKHHEGNHRDGGRGDKSSRGMTGNVGNDRAFEPSTPTKRGEIEIEKLKETMASFLSDMADILSSGDLQLQQKTAFQLDEIELSVELNSEGQVCLFGVGGKTGGKGAITLTLKRKGGV